MDLYEMKREIVNFSKNISKGLNKSTSKFVMDMQYGIAKSKTCLISGIARELDETIKLNNTIERLCDNLVSLNDDEVSALNNNYINEVKDLFADEPIAIFDDSDIAKRYGKKFEDLDDVLDASSLKKEIVPGYHVCEAVVLTKKEKQPISLYSKIYSIFPFSRFKFVSGTKWLKIMTLNRVISIFQVRLIYLNNISITVLW